MRQRIADFADSFRRALPGMMIVLLLLVCVQPAPIVEPIANAKVVKILVVKTGTGAATQITTDTTIYSAKVTFQNDPASGAKFYIGDSAVTSANCWASLTAGTAYTITPSVHYAQQNEQFQLSTIYCLGTASDKLFVTYEDRQ